jgi:hypothetical protein
VHVDVLPPRSNEHRDRLFDLLFSSRTGCCKRRAILENNLRGDLTGDAVDVYLFGVAEPDVPLAVGTWAVETALALLPTSTKIFPRHRWLTCTSCLEGPALLANTHNLLSRVVPRWVAEMGSSKPSTKEPEVAAHSVDQLVLFDPLGEGSHKDPKTAWVEENERARGDVVAMAESSPGIPLLVMRCTLAPLVALFDRLLHEGSHEWDREQQLAEIRGESRQYRILNAYTGASIRAFFNQVGSILCEGTSLDVVPPAGRTYEARTLALSITSRAMAGVFFHLRLPSSQYPIQTLLSPRFARH